MQIHGSSIPAGPAAPDHLKVIRARAYRLRFAAEKRLLGMFLGLTAAASAFAAPLELPALMQPASVEHHVGKVIFVELVTPDLAAAKQFYGELFGWSFQDAPAGALQYSQASLDGFAVAGLIQKEAPPGEHRQPAWLSFMSVRDVDAAKDMAVQHGAKVLFQPHSIPDRGREAILADPQGAVFAILASSSGDPPDVLAAPGEWIWSSLITSDPEADVAFYQTLFDYEVFDLPADKGAQHLLLASEEYARASANTLPANHLNAHPHWLNFIRVDNATKTAAKVVTLGGRVLVEPRMDRHGGMVAVVADQQGAPFGLLEWPDTETKAVAQ
jgi:uncharacterized protein